MPEENTLFGKLDKISAENSVILNEIAGLKEQASKNDSRVVELDSKIKKYEEYPATVRPTPSTQPVPTTTVSKPSDKDILHTFLKKSKKSWRWFGTRAEFSRWKTMTIVSLIVLVILGTMSTIVTGISCGMYSGISVLENAWLIFGFIYLSYASKTKLTYEVNELASNSSSKYETDELGMKFHRKEKTIFGVFRWIAAIGTVANIIFIWTRRSNFSALATVLELLFLAAIIVTYFINLNLYAQYSIIWVEGHNLTTNEKVVLVLPPGAKGLMTLEEFKKKMPFFFE